MQTNDYLILHHNFILYTKKLFLLIFITVQKMKYIDTTCTWALQQQQIVDSRAQLGSVDKYLWWVFDWYWSRSVNVINAKSLPLLFILLTNFVWCNALVITIPWLKIHSSPRLFLRGKFEYIHGVRKMESEVTSYINQLYDFTGNEMKRNKNISFKLT